MGKMRSPNYPAVGLSVCIQAAKDMWAKEKRTSVSPDVVAKAFGYSGLNGPARTMLSALRKYGLLEDDREKVRLSDLALRIVHSPESSPDYIKAVQEAALLPEIFRELLATHSDGSDDALKSYLLIDRKFSDEGAKQFIKAFRDTIAIAKLKDSVYNGSSITTENADMPETTVLEKRQKSKMDELLAGLPEHVRQQMVQHTAKSYPVPLKKQNQATITFQQLPLEKTDIQLLKKWIDLMEENLTEAPNDPLEE